jgi:hypothetical protein
MVTDDAETGMQSTVSTTAGLETPETLQLRKSREGTGTETPDQASPRSASACARRDLVVDLARNAAARRRPSGAVHSARAEGPQYRRM